MSKSNNFCREGKYDYCFIGSGVILNRMLAQAPIKESRCLVISDQFHDGTISFETNSFTVLSRASVIQSLDEFDIGTLVILAKTHLWSQPDEFEKLILKLRTTVRSKVIHVSSGSVYGETPTNVDESFQLNPSTTYGVRKVLEEKCVTNSFAGRTSVIILRVSNVYGDPLFHDFTNLCLKAVIEKSPVKVYSGGEIARDFLFVDCLVKALLGIIVLKPSSDCLILNLSTGVATSMKKMIKHISNATGLDISKVDYRRPDELVKRSVLDNSAIVKAIPWVPMTVEKGIEFYLLGSFPDLINEK